MFFMFFKIFIFFKLYIFIIIYNYLFIMIFLSFVVESFKSYNVVKLIICLLLIRRREIIVVQALLSYIHWSEFNKRIKWPMWLKIISNSKRALFIRFELGIILNHIGHFVRCKLQPVSGRQNMSARLLLLLPM